MSVMLTRTSHARVHKSISQRGPPTIAPCHMCMHAQSSTHAPTMYHTHRFGQLAVTLRYATRDTFVRGQDDILAKPVLTMAQEFDR